MTPYRSSGYTCIKKRPDTVGEPISTRYSRDCCVGFARFLYLQQWHMRGPIFGTGGFANSIRPFFATAPVVHNTIRSAFIAGAGLLTTRRARRIRSPGLAVMAFTVQEASPEDAKVELVCIIAEHTTPRKEASHVGHTRQSHSSYRCQQRHRSSHRSGAGQQGHACRPRRPPHGSARTLALPQEH